MPTKPSKAGTAVRRKMVGERGPGAVIRFRSGENWNSFTFSKKGGEGGRRPS